MKRIGKKNLNPLNNKYILWLIFLSFSFLNVDIYMHFNYLFGGQDLQFHLQRIDELYNNICHGNLFPYIATYNFNQLGSAVMSMYPKLPLYFFAIIRLAVKQPIISYYIAIWMSTFICMIISYYCYLSINKLDKLGGILFAVAYSLSGLCATYYFLMADLGISFSLIFLPLVYAGFYHLIKSGHYKMMTIGIILVSLSHLINAIIVLISLIVLLLTNLRTMNLKKYIHLGVSFILSILSTSSFWIPAFYFGHHVNMSAPFVFNLNGINLITMFENGLSNGVLYGISLIPILGLILGVIFYKGASRASKQAFWLSVGLIIVSSSLFPWIVFQNSIIKYLQFPWRLLIIPQLLFTYIFSESFSKLLKKIKYPDFQKILIILTFLTLIVLSQNSQLKRINFEMPSPEINSQLSPNISFPYKDGIAWYKITNIYEYQNLMDFNGVMDYLPKTSTQMFDTIATHNAILNNGKTIPTRTYSYGKYLTINFKLNKRAQYIDLPFFIYNKKNYRVIINGKHSLFELGQNNLLRLKKLNRGNYSIKITFHNSIMSVIILTMSILGGIGIFIPNKILKRRTE